MLLTLKVISCRGQQPPEQTSACFDQKSGTIGRATDNDLVLPDPEHYISRHHAEIRFEAGRYILVDTSLSGTVVDDGEPLKKGSIELCDGMHVYIGDYEITVEIRQAGGEEGFGDDFSESALMTDFIRGGPDADLDQALRSDSFQDFNEPTPFSFPDDEGDPFAAFEDEKAPIPDPLAELESKSPTFDSFEPPNANLESPSVDLPDDFNIEELLGTATPAPEPVPKPFPEEEIPIDDAFDIDLTGPFPEEESPPPVEVVKPQPRAPEPEVPREAEKPSVQPEPPRVEIPPVEIPSPEIPDVEVSSPEIESREPPVPKPAATPTSRERSLDNAKLLEILLKAAGVDDAGYLREVDEEETARLIGRMFHDLLEGIMTLLRSRAELKNQFRVSRTMIRPVENNPLKFEVTVPNVLETLLKPGQRGYLRPLDAIQNGFNDVTNHQLAMTAGIQASLTHLLQNFDPERFEKKVEGGLFKNKDAKCWEAYIKDYERLVAESVEDFFGSAFVNAYEKQIQVLESIGGKK